MSSGGIWSTGMFRLNERCKGSRRNPDSSMQMSSLPLISAANCGVGSMTSKSPASMPSSPTLLSGTTSQRASKSTGSPQ